MLHVLARASVVCTVLMFTGTAVPEFGGSIEHKIVTEALPNKPTSIEQ